MPHNSVHNSQELDLRCVKKKYISACLYARWYMQGELMWDIANPSRGRGKFHPKSRAPRYQPEVVEEDEHSHLRWQRRSNFTLTGWNCQVHNLTAKKGKKKSICLSKAYCLFLMDTLRVACQFLSGYTFIKCMFFFLNTLFHSLFIFIFSSLMSILSCRRWGKIAVSTTTYDDCIYNSTQCGAW